MSQKRPGSDSAESGSKKSRKTITLEMKLDVLTRFEAGGRAVDIGRDLGLPPTTVRTIRANADKIKGSLKSLTPLSASKINRTRSSHMENMERLLAVWIEDQNQRNVRVSVALIQEKARSLYEELTKEQSEGSQAEGFGASRGWFDRFKRRSSLRHVRAAGEAAGAAAEAAETFPASLKKIIKEGGYSPQQVFNVDETGLYWKCLLSRTFISTDEKIAQAAKDRLTLLLGGNAAGDFKFKPLLMYHSLTPKALRGYSKEHLRVIWRSNKNVWITVTLFQEWFTLYAIPALKEYCAKENLDFKILLILDNAPGHPINIDDLSENVKVIFMPPNTTSLLQPMDQGVIATFKAYYLRHTFSQLIREIDGEGKPTIKECWREYNILQAIDNIADSWAEVSSACMNVVWQKIWPECVNGFRGFVDVIPKIHREIVKLAKESGFDEVEEADVVELLASHGEELSNEDLMQLEVQRAEEEELTVETFPPRMLTTKRLSKAFQLIEEAMAIFSEDDPNREHSSKVKRTINDGINCYKDLYQEKKKQADQQSTFRLMQSGIPNPNSKFKKTNTIYICIPSFDNK